MSAVGPPLPAPAVVLAAALVLAAGTYALRLAGPVLRSRVRFPPSVIRVLALGSTVLLTALAAVTALTEGHGFAGWARPLGVAVGAVLAWRRVPLPIVVLAAAGTAAGARLLGLR